MHVTTLLCVILSLSVVSAQEEGTQNQSQEQRTTPTTLAEAHAELERTLPPEELAKIDAMQSEDEMIQYHMGLGMGIRNSWGLWAGGPLAKHMQELGFTHPDDMSGVILETFWCKRHGKDFRLEERAAHYREYWDAMRRDEEEEKTRVEKSNAAIQSMMMGLRFEKQDVPVVSMPIRGGASVRFMSPFRDGVFLTVYCQGRSRGNPIHSGGYYVDPADGKTHRRPDVDDSVMRGFYVEGSESLSMKPGEDFYTLGFYFDLTNRKLRRIVVPEVNEVYAAVVAGDRAWFAGLTNGKMVLVGVGDQDRITATLPREDEIPDLGIDGQSLLAVYSQTIYHLAEREWKLIHSGDIVLPRSGLPPQRHGNMVFLRDEGIQESYKRFWWLAMGEKPRLRLLGRDTGLFEPIISEEKRHTRMIGPAGWEEASSHCVTANGDLWACVAGGAFLLRRSMDGSYAVAIAYGSTQFSGNVPKAGRANRGLSISAVTALNDGVLLLAGKEGLYRLHGNELTQELAFTCGAVDANGAAYGNSWTPNTILAMDDRSYVIGTAAWDGVYLIRKDDNGQWNCLPTEDIRDTVVW